MNVNCLKQDSQLEKHEEALVDEERWRSLHEVNESCTANELLNVYDL